MLFGLTVAAAWLLLDQATKWLILERVMSPDPRVIPVTSFFDIVLGWNRGVSFGFLGASGVSPWVLALLATVIVVVLGWSLKRAESRVTALGFGLIIGGALGNVADRLRHGAVVDFLDFHVSGWHWPAFNFADVGIVCGVALILLDGMFSKNRREAT